MSFEDLIRRAENDRKAGKAGAWSTRVEGGPCVGDKTVAELYHYSTLMLTWTVGDPDDSEVLDWSLGWGSVSDQQGMNKAFRILGLPYYFSRSGGAEIVRHNNVRPSDAPLARR
jgi:hypothetical protein